VDTLYEAVVKMDEEGLEKEATDFDVGGKKFWLSHMHHN
jgi:hypothetical protein